MIEINNCSIYDMPESIVSASYAMLTSQDDIDKRVRNMRYWLSFGDFLPSFIEYYNKQGKNVGEDTPNSCYKCGGGKAQRNNVQGKGHYYCSKHNHKITRYGNIIDDVTYTFLENGDVRLDVCGEKNNVRTSIVSSCDIPIVFGKNLNLSGERLKVNGELYYTILAHNLGIESEQIDHIDRNPCNNTRRNLRPCNAAQNVYNRGKQKARREINDVVGVNYCDRTSSWTALIMFNGVQRYLGRYKDKKDAIKARLTEEKNIFGAFSPNIDLFEEYGIEKPEISTFPQNDYDLELAIKDFNRMVRLVQSSKKSKDVHCFDNALIGVRVAFDLKYPNYLSPELQRYHFLDIVCSSSKMHRLVKMDMDKCFNEYVLDSTKGMMKRLIEEYNDNPTEENFMRVISNCPQGIELFMRCTTNYKQLQTIYAQRKNHKLPEWRAFCKWIETLPYSQELILGL